MARARSTSRLVSKTWSGSQNGTPVVLTSTPQIMISFSTTSAETLLRSRGRIFVQGTPDASNENDIAIFGLITLSDEAAAAGGASLPSPVGSPDAQWIWYDYAILFDGISTAANAASIGLNHRLEVDSKSMRKVSPNQTLALIGELATSEMVTVNAFAGLRVLLAFA